MGEKRMKRLNPLDASWLSVESHDTPMHVGNLQIFSLPKNAPDDFLGQMVTRIKSERNYASPWNLKLRSPKMGGVFNAWKIDNNLDLDYHVRHSALPAPGGERELGVLISRLHSHQLDFKRPLWECHVIEGLENNRYALYTKMHHSLIDGVSGVRLLQRILSTDPNELVMPAPWTVQPDRTRSADAPAETAQSAEQVAAKALSSKGGSSVPQLIKALTRIMRGSPTSESGLTGTISGPISVLNRRVTGQRRFATQQYDLRTLKDLAKYFECALNDIVLYLSSSALRRFMEESNTLPKQPLTTN